MSINMKKAREAAGLSQKQVALTMKVSPPTVSDWESGKIKPTADKLKKLSDLYKVSVDYLLGLTEVAFKVMGNGTTPTIGTIEPISILFSLYPDLSVDTFSDISGIPSSIVEDLSVVATPLHGVETKNPLYKEITDEQYHRIADFFHIDYNELKSESGYVTMPIFPYSDVQYRITELTGIRFAAYDKTDDFTPEELSKIKEFADFIKSGRNRLSNKE